MIEYLVPAAVSFFASLVLTPTVRRLAVRVGAVDSPGKRKIHKVPVPRLGGVSIALSSGLAFLVSLWLEQVTVRVFSLDYETWMALLMGATIIFLIGVWDDLRPVSPWVKFLFQMMAAGVAIRFGIRVEHISLFGGDHFALGLLAWPITLVWMVGITNAFNLVDGLDGLAAGLASIAAFTSATIFFLKGDASNALFLVILLGALAGFLPYNFNPAKIFLGDSGSLVIGYILAVTAVTGSQKQALALAVVIPLLVFGLPILDTLLSMARRFIGSLRLLESYKAPIKERIRCVRKMFEADQGHIHHRVLAMGLSHRNAVLVLYVAALCLSFLALISVLAQYRNSGIILIVVGLAAYIGIHKLGYEEVRFLRAGTLLRWCEQLTFGRSFFLGFVDITLISGAYCGSFVLKYEVVSAEMKAWHVETFPLVLLIQMGFFFVFGLYRGVWRAVGIGDLLQVGTAAGASVALSYSVAVINRPPEDTAFSFFCIDFLLLATLVAGSRSLHRVLNYLNQHERANGNGALIYGAGHVGQFVLGELLQNATLKLRPIGFIDDEPTLWNRTVNRVPVLGSSNDLASVLKHRPVTALIISSNKINGDRLQRAISLCRQQQIAVLRFNLSFEPVGADSLSAKLQPSAL